jgi:hypothetical protein
MASFAEIDNNNIVVRVVAVPDSEEHRGQEFLANDLQLGGTWIKTSYNTREGVHLLGGTPLRHTYAGIGWTYNPDTDEFEFPNGKYFVNMDEQGIWHSTLNTEWKPEDN